MKRNHSNPLRVILSGVLDFIVYVVVLVIVFAVLKTEWHYHFNGRVYPFVNLMAIAFTIVYVFFLLPIFDYQGGSMGKRALALKCVPNRKGCRSFVNYFLKNLLFGIPVLLTFVFSFRMFGMQEDDVVFAIRTLDILIVSVFLSQAVSLFTSSISLFERVSGTKVVGKNYQEEPEVFSFENPRNDYIH